MADTVRLRINLPRLAANLSAAEQREIPENEAVTFLTDHHFVPLGGDVWTCEEVSLRLLDRSEILELEHPR